MRFYNFFIQGIWFLLLSEYLLLWPMCVSNLEKFIRWNSRRWLGCLCIALMTVIDIYAYKKKSPSTSPYSFYQLNWEWKQNMCSWSIRHILDTTNLPIPWSWMSELREISVCFPGVALQDITASLKMRTFGFYIKNKIKIISYFYLSYLYLFMNCTYGQSFCIYSV